MQGPIFWIVLSMHPQMMPAVFRLSFPEVILGTRARKVRTKSFQAFTSINYPSLAVIQDGRKIQYIHQVKAATAEFYHKMDPKSDC